MCTQVIGLVGSSRKRILLLWQAVEFSRSCDRPNLATLQARPRPAVLLRSGASCRAATLCYP